MLVNCDSRPALGKRTSIYIISCSTLFLESTTGAPFFPLTFVCHGYLADPFFAFTLDLESTTGTYFLWLFFIFMDFLADSNTYLTYSIE